MTRLDAMVQEFGMYKYQAVGNVLIVACPEGAKPMRGTKEDYPGAAEDRYPK
ncbi:expressed protein, partial [Baffinella frigidus]